MSKKQKTQMYASGGSVRSSKDSEYYKDRDPSTGAAVLTRRGSDADKNAKSVARGLGNGVTDSNARTGLSSALGEQERRGRRESPGSSAYTRQTRRGKERDGK